MSPQPAQGQPIGFDQIQAIQETTGSPAAAAAACTPKKKLRPYHPGAKRYWQFGPTTISVGPGYQTCTPAIHIVSPGPCKAAPQTDDKQVQTIAEGIGRGFQQAPTIVIRPAPWNEPDYRGTNFPQTGFVVISTFATTDVRVTQAKQAFAGYLGTNNVTVSAVQATTGTPAQVLGFMPDSAYRGQEIVVASTSLQLLLLAGWTVTVNGKVRVSNGPFKLVGGKAKIAINAARGESVALNIILPTSMVICAPLTVQINGFTYPVLTNTDGIYPKSLRNSPSWPRSNTV